jgi:hypothetical protein
MQEAEIGRITIPGQLGQKTFGEPFQLNKTECGGTSLSSQLQQEAGSRLTLSKRTLSPK